MIADAALDMLILDRIRSAYVIDIAELRIAMPHALRGPSFDAAILRLADAGRIVLSQDCEPEAIESQDGYIHCAAVVYTTAAIRWSNPARRNLSTKEIA